jgi:hypothetical protein
MRDTPRGVSGRQERPSRRHEWLPAGSRRSSAGGVDITVPAGAEAYRVDATSSAGSTDIGVPTDPQADRRIQAHSSAGSVHVPAGG